MDALCLQHFSFIGPSVKSRTCASTKGHCRISYENSSASPIRASSRKSQLFCRSLAGESVTTTTDESPVDLTSGGAEIVDESVALLKRAAKTRKVPSGEVIAALCTLEKAKLDPTSFLATIGGSPDAPGPRTWMLVFSADKEQVSQTFKGEVAKGSYVPITAVQKFDATKMAIENGAYLGALGSLVFSGRFSWNNRILAFLFDTVYIKLGALGPFKFNFEKKKDKGRTPTNKDPFFVWHYADEEIVVARGRGGGLAFWCRCKRVVS